MKFSLSIISFMNPTFDVVSKKPLSFPMWPRFYSMLSSRSFIVLCSHLVLCSELIFVKDLRSVYRFTFWLNFHMLQHYFLKGPLYCLCSSVKNQLPIFILVYFWALCSVPLIYLFILFPISHCLNYCKFVKSLEIKYI